MTSKHDRIRHRGKTQTIAEWATELGIHERTLVTRLKRGWTSARALETPVAEYKDAIILRHKGKSMSLNQWAKEIGISQFTMRYRYNNWPHKRLFEAKIHE